MKAQLREYRLTAGRHKATVYIFPTSDMFRRSVAQFMGDKVDKSLEGRFMARENQPKTGHQGIIATSVEYATVDVLAHEFMHMAFHMSKKNGEEKAVTVAAGMLAKTIGMLRSDGFKVKA